jgi:hypothetical protein
MVTALAAADPSKSEQEHLFNILHTPRGRDVANHMNELSKKGDPPMTRTEELHTIAKTAGGMELICKHITDHGTTNISEHEFSSMLTEYATQKGISFEKALADRATAQAYAMFAMLVRCRHI